MGDWVGGFVLFGRGIGLGGLGIWGLRFGIPGWVWGLGGLGLGSGGFGWGLGRGDFVGGQGGSLVMVCDGVRRFYLKYRIPGM